MPNVFRVDGFRFFFYSDEGDPREPVHVHVRRAGAEAKFWIEPRVRLARADGFDSRTLRRLLDIVVERADEIRRAWHEHFGD